MGVFDGQSNAAEIAFSPARRAQLHHHAALPLRRRAHVDLQVVPPHGRRAHALVTFRISPRPTTKDNQPQTTPITSTKQATAHKT